MSLLNPGCPHCGMPPLDGEPCCNKRAADIAPADPQPVAVAEVLRELRDLAASKKQAVDGALSDDGIQWVKGNNSALDWMIRAIDRAAAKARMLAKAEAEDGCPIGVGGLMMRDDDPDQKRTCPYTHSASVGVCIKCGWSAAAKASVPVATSFDPTPATRYARQQIESLPVHDGRIDRESVIQILDRDAAWPPQPAADQSKLRERIVSAVFRGGNAGRIAPYPIAQAERVADLVLALLPAQAPAQGDVEELEELRTVKDKWSKACAIANAHLTPYVRWGESVFEGIPKMASELEKVKAQGDEAAGRIALAETQRDNALREVELLEDDLANAKAQGDADEKLRRLREWMLKKWPQTHDGRRTGEVIAEIDRLLAEGKAETPEPVHPPKRLCDRPGCTEEVPGYAWQTRDGTRRFCSFECHEKRDESKVAESCATCRYWRAEDENHLSKCCKTAQTYVKSKSEWCGEWRGR